MAKNKNHLAWHILAGLIFMALPAIISPHPPGEKDYLLSGPTIRDFISNGMMLIFFYFNYYFLISKLYFRKHYVWYGLILVITMLIIIFVPSLMTGFNPFSHAEFTGKMPDVSIQDHHLPNNFRGGPKGHNQDITSFLYMVNHNILLFVSVILFSILLKTSDRLLLSEKSKHDAELGSLKSQIQPHFLFNTLNSIYVMAIREQSLNTANSILKLSGLMRFVVSETGRKYVSLEKELAYLNDYIELQKLRLDKKVKLNYMVENKGEGCKIAPLLLMPFIENAFKHGVNPDEDSKINIYIRVEGKLLEMLVENNKVKVLLEEHETSGQGIQNTMERLELIYPKKHQLTIKETPQQYRVALSINLS
ncbi:histidine kinase [Echinicola marina]|uniref:sensor histidine kinase n=1 Tax=Echinicola marina TaxID=2859768 RepID=UPI001CF6C443|nr:histidine kinase [Echinicola marina]UCS92570.1 histidine kinase [Echinicola marina]